MKKLVMFAAVAVMSLVASATNCKWGLGSGGTFSGVSTGTAYLVYGTIPASISGSSFSEGTITAAGGQVLDSGAIADSFFSNLAGTSLTPTSTGLDKGNKSVYMVAISSDGKKMLVSNSTKTLNLQASALSSTIQWNGTDFTAYPVPEPTSALLMVLGVAGLALKRKRA